MRDEVVPRRYLCLEILRIRVRQRAELEVPVVSIVNVEGKVILPLRRFHHSRVLEAVAQAERTVVMEVVAEKHVRGAGLRARRAKRRMRVEQRHGRCPPPVRHSHNSHATIVPRHVLHQPVNGVVRITRFVDRAFHLGVARRAQHHELPLTLVAAAQILRYDDVAVASQLVHRLSWRDRFNDALTYPIRRTYQQHRQSLARASGNKDLGVEPYSVAHWNHHRVAVERSVYRSNRCGKSRRRLRAELHAKKHERGDAERYAICHFSGEYAGGCVPRLRLRGFTVPLP